MIDFEEDRPGTILQVWREITVEFWDRAPDRDETLRELQETGYPEKKRRQCLELLAGRKRDIGPCWAIWSLFPPKT